MPLGVWACLGRFEIVKERSGWGAGGLVGGCSWSCMRGSGDAVGGVGRGVCLELEGAEGGGGADASVWSFLEGGGVRWSVAEGANVGLVRRSFRMLSSWA